MSITYPECLQHVVILYDTVTGSESIIGFVWKMSLGLG